MSYFGGRKDPKQATREAIVTLRQQLQMLEKKEEYLQKKADEELKKAKANAVTNKAGMLASLLRSSVLIDALNSFLIMIPVNKSPLLHYDGRRRPSKNSID